MKSPTFLLKPSAYEAGTLYSVLPENGDGDFTVTTTSGIVSSRIDRNGVMRFNASDEPRVDYLGGVPKLLLEPTRINYAAAANFSGWSATGCTLTGASGYSPDGQHSAYIVEDDTSTTTNGYIQESIAMNDNTQKQCFSFFVKFVACEKITVLLVAGSASARFEVSESGTVTIDDANTTSGSVLESVRYPNGWFRVETVIDPGSSGTNYVAQIMMGGYNDPIYTGSFFVWGNQFEEGEFCTSYMSVVGTARNADVMNVGSLITNNIINRSLGSLFLDVHVYNNGLADSTGNMVTLGTTSGLLSLRSTSNGTPSYARVTGASTTTEQQVSEGRNRILFNMDGDTVETWINGTLAATDSNGDVGLTSEVFTLNGAYNVLKVYEIAMWDTPLDATESKSMTQ